jgi:hypothetical protein
MPEGDSPPAGHTGERAYANQLERDLVDEPDRLPPDRDELERLPPDLLPPERDVDDRLPPDRDPEEPERDELDPEDARERDEAEPERDELERDELERDEPDPEVERERDEDDPERDDALLDDRRELLAARRRRLVPPLRSAAGISSRATAFASCAICFSRNFAIRSSSRRMPRASLAVSLSPTVSASDSMPA